MSIEIITKKVIQLPYVMSWDGRIIVLTKRGNSK